MTKLVIIGGVAAGMSAAGKAKRTNPKMQVEVYTDEEYISYAGCGLPYYAQGIIQDQENLVVRKKEQFHKEGIEVYTGSTVTAINPANKEITVLDSGRQLNKVSYDKLIIATGARPIIPDFYRTDLENVFTVKKIPDIVKLRDVLQSGKIQKAVVVGGGYIGMEMIEALAQWKVEVTVVHLHPNLLNNIDPDMSQELEMYLTQQGVKVRTGEAVLALEGSGKVEKVITDRGEIPADLVVVAVGVIPNSQLAAQAGLELGPKGAIRVNAYMETSSSDIYAVGDCATAFHLLLEADTHIPLATTANKQGRIAGENAAGGRVAFPGIIGTAVMKVMDLEIGRTGLSREEALKASRRIREVKITDQTLPHYYPGTGNVTIKLLLDELNNKIIGVQIVGKQGSGKRIDLLAMAAQLGLTPYDLARLDLSYAPPFSPVWDPILVAANIAVNEIEK